jgi:hypothetical protein
MNQRIQISHHLGFHLQDLFLGISIVLRVMDFGRDAILAKESYMRA